MNRRNFMKILGLSPLVGLFGHKKESLPDGFKHVDDYKGEELNEDIFAGGDLGWKMGFSTRILNDTLVSVLILPDDITHRQSEAICKRIDKYNIANNTTHIAISRKALIDG